MMMIGNKISKILTMLLKRFFKENNLSLSKKP